MRLFIILNETATNPHINVHNALEALRAKGAVESEVFPFRIHLESGLASEEVLRELAQRAIVFGPDAMLWAHTAGLYASKNQLAVLREKCNNPVFGYWEGDLYEAPYKRLPDEVAELASACDVVFVQGFGPMTDELAAAGCTDIRFVPATTDEWRFGKQHASAPEFDVVLIGTNAASRLPWRTMPGARWRKRLVQLFEKQLGRRFAVFGHGWHGPSARGPLAFERQSYAYGQGRLALGVNNLHARYYFSNRLPIAMSSCVPVIYNYEQGFDSLFPPNSGCMFFRETKQAWDIAHSLLSGDDDRLIDMGEAAQHLAFQRFTIIKIFHYMCDVLRSYPRCRYHCRRAGAHVMNPWLDQMSRGVMTNF